MDRLHNLESLVKELSSQLKESQAASSSGEASSSGIGSPDGQITEVVEQQESTGVDKQFGRLVVQDANHSRYVSSGFWSRINDEAS